MFTTMTKIYELDGVEEGGKEAIITPSVRASMTALRSDQACLWAGLGVATTCWRDDSGSGV
jgi:hypothetical protein